MRLESVRVQIGVVMRSFSLFGMFARSHLHGSYSVRRYLFASIQRQVTYEVVHHPRFRFPYSNYCAQAAPTTRSATTTCEDNSQLLNTMSGLISGDDFHQLVNHPVFTNCNHNLQNFNDDELLELTHLLDQVHVKFGSVLYHDDDILRSLARKIDEELCKRYRSIDDKDRLVEFLQACHRLPKQNYSFWICLLKTRLKPALKWPTPMMMKFIRLVHQADVWHVYYVDKYRIEFAAMKHLPFLGINDFALFLRIMTKLDIVVNTPNLFVQICDLFVRELPLASPSTIHYFAMYFRNHATKVNSASIKELASTLMALLHPRMNSLQLNTLICIAELLNNVFYCDRIFLEKFASRFADEMSQLSPENLVKAVHILIFFNIHFDSVNPYNRLLTYLKTEPLTLLRNQPRRLVKILYLLSKIGIYDHELTDIVLSSAFLFETYKKLDRYHVSSFIYALNESVTLDFPDYRGSKLSESLRQAFVHHLQSIRILPELLSVNHPVDKNDECFVDARPYERLLFDVRLTLASLLGGFEYLHVGYPLAYLKRPTVIFCLKDGVPQMLGAGFDLPRPQDDDKSSRWYSVTFYSQNTMPSNTESLLLYDGVLQKRHMEKLRYHSLPVVVDVWKSINTDEKREHVKKLIFGE